MNKLVQAAGYFLGSVALGVAMLVEHFEAKGKADWTEKTEGKCGSPCSNFYCTCLDGGG